MRLKTKKDNKQKFNENLTENVVEAVKPYFGLQNMFDFAPNTKRCRSRKAIFWPSKYVRFCIKHQ